MSFKIEDNVLVQYNRISNRTLRNAKHMSLKWGYLWWKIHKDLCKNIVANTIFSDNKILKESIHYICIAAISIDWKNPQVHLEECKYEINKKKMTKLITTKLELYDLDDSNDPNDFNDSNDSNESNSK